MAQYNYSDGNVVFASNGDTTLQLMNDNLGDFDIRHFSFLRSGNDLIIYADNGRTITLQDHYTSSSSFLFINYGTAAQPKLQLISDSPSVQVGTTADATLTTNEHILGGTGNNIINANASRIYAGDGDDVITNNSNGGRYTGNIIYAGDGNDTIYEGVGAGDDAHGGNGDDTFHANASVVNGSVWRGGAGNDTYHVNINSSGTTIYDESGSLDTLHFGAGLNFENFLMYSFSNDMTIVSKDTGALNVFKVTLKEQYTANIDKVVFADGTTYRIENGIDWYADDGDNVIQAAAGLYNLHGGLGNDIIRGVVYVDTPEYGVHATNWIPTLYGDEGDDVIYHGWTGTGGPRSGGVSYGGTGDDIIHGTDYDDAMFGGDGNDTLYAYSHDDATRDIMDGGNGDDTFYIGSGTQKDVEGGDGCDVIFADLNLGVSITGSGKTHLKGGAGNDVYVFLRDDSLGAISAKAWINDTSGDFDTIALGDGFNLGNVEIQTTSFLKVTDLHSTLDYHMIEVNPNFPGNVIERVVFADGTIYDTLAGSVLTATNGDDDPIYLTAWHDRFDALGGNDVVYALKGDDVVDGNTGDDILFGENGDDTLIGGAGTDTLDGGDGIDTADYSGATSGITVNLQNQAATDDGQGGSDTLISIERIIGSEFADHIIGSNFGDEILEGRGGNDTLGGYVGDDVLLGGDGDDTLLGYGGTDLLEGGEGNDQLRGGSDRDVLNGGNGNDVFDDTIDSVIDGGDGASDWARFYHDTGRLDLDLERAGAELRQLDASTGTFTGVEGSIVNVEVITATHLDDILRGDSGSNILRGFNGDDEIHGRVGDDKLQGNNGNDTLHGNEGNDSLYGGDGNDELHGGADGDYLDGDAGDDVLYGDAGDDGLVGDLGNDTLYGGLGNDNVYGNDGNDTLYGEEGQDLVKGANGNDVLYGGADTDSLFGGADNDELHGGDGDDYVDGDEGDDVLYGDAGNDSVFGDLGNDVLHGGAGNDLLQGNSGNDTLYGGSGADTLKGSTGADTFVWLGADLDGSVDILTDFSLADGDVLDFSGVIAGYDPLTDVITDFVQITESGSSTTIAIDADGGADGFVTTATLIGVTGLDAATLLNDGDLII